MKCMIPNMVETMEAMQHMMSNDSASGRVPESQVKEKPTKQSHKGSSTESVNSNCFGSSAVSHNSKN